MMKLTQGAEQDLADAIAWYNSQRDGLGFEFLDAVERLMQRIEATPLQFPKVEGRNRRRNLRQALLRRFPYRIIFEIMDDESLLGQAVAHTSRRPRYWNKRD